MTRASSTTAAALLVLLSAASGGAAQTTHRLTVELEPERHLLSVTDQVTFQESETSGPVEFLLNSTLAILEASPPVEELAPGDPVELFGLNLGGAGIPEGVELKRYRTAEAPVNGMVTLTYQGPVHYPLSEQKEEYTRGFRETAGLIGEEGVYLAGSSFWYPWTGEELVEFELAADLPEGWRLISQGDGTSRDHEGRAHWVSGGPVDEIYLVGGPLVEYSQPAGPVDALVLLRQPDDALAAKYLEATGRYIEMYRELIGPYPYGKFALVENFWETGYGMASFTLLGPAIIRFPFILTSSYPHEILHNWWGNSVFVDYRKGNWAEGLTAYLADHLLQEQRGQGAEHRRAALQKYRDYVQEGRDFPLAEFRSRHSAATEAVGYGKTMMGFHMLRRRLGDETFRGALQRLYGEHRGRRASFDDVQAAFEGASGEDLEWFFAPWVERAGAAALAVEVDETEQDGERYVVRGRLIQGQEEPPFELEVPVAVQTADGVEIHRVPAAGRITSLAIPVAARPLALAVDPRFDLFRRLDPRETPPSIGQIFGEPAILALLPDRSPAEVQDRYRRLVESWQSDSHHIEVRLDAEVATLPDDRAAWILGRDNRFAAELFGGDLPGLTTSDEGFRLEESSLPWSDHCLVTVRRHPATLDKAVGWLVADSEEAIPGLGRKLPHYGKYSYLAFAGAEPSNVAKGQWPTSDSPLHVDLRSAAEGASPRAPMALPEERPLAELPAVFSQRDLEAHVVWLAAPEREGRGVGTAGLETSARYIAERLEAAGLHPGGDDGTFFQRLTLPAGPDGEPAVTANVVGYLPGSRQEWREQWILVSAHYDHLGRGWPDVHQGDQGEIHPGADDNASGVAVLLELARVMAAADAPQRTLAFVAFTAEEAGRAGSKYLVEHPAPLPLEGLRAVVNIDTVGRLGEGGISALGTGTAEEWQHIFRGVSFVTGVASRNVPESAEGSDQLSFIERGIPGVQVFTGAHDDYHRPSDTAEKVDAAGLVKVATWLEEVVEYLVGREEPLTVTIEGSGPAEPSAEPSTGRRARLGTVPDFAFPGPGVKVDSVAEGSPAERAGIESGDVLMTLDGREISDLRGYSEILKSLEPGQSVEVTVRRGERELALTAVLEVR